MGIVAIWPKLDCSCLEAIIGKLDWLSKVFKWFESRQDYGYIR